MSDTPITDSSIIERRHIHKRGGSVELLELLDANVSRKLERECAKAIRALTNITALPTMAVDHNVVRARKIAQEALRNLEAATDPNN